MLFAIGYTIIGTLALWGIYLFVSPKWPRFIMKNPLMLAVINGILSAAFLAMYLVNPGAFSAEAAVTNSAFAFIFTVFATYFYFFIIPISGLQIIVTLRNKLYNSLVKRYLTVLSDALSLVAIIYISVNLL